MMGFFCIGAKITSIMSNMFLCSPVLEAPKKSAGIMINHTIDKRKLRKFHQQVLQKCFPVEDVQKTRHFIADVEEGAYRVILAEEGETILGGIVIEHFEARDFMLVAWLAIEESHRKRNIGTLLVEAARDYARQNGATYLIGEIEDPQVFEEIEPAYGDPLKRAQFYSRFDCQRIEVPYVITSYGEDDEPLFDIMLTLFPLSEEQIMATELNDPRLAVFVEELVGSDTAETYILVETCKRTVALTPFKKLFLES